MSSPTVSKMLPETEITQASATTIGKTKTVTTTQDFGTTTTDIPSTASITTITRSSSPTLPETEITQPFTTTTGKTKTEKKNHVLGTTTTDIPSKESTNNTTHVSSPTVPVGTVVKENTQTSISTGTTETVTTTICPDIMVPKSCNCTAVIAKKVGTAAVKLIIDPLIAALKEKWKKKIAELKGLLN